MEQDQRDKKHKEGLFVCNLWSWVKGSLVESHSSLVSFVDWIGS